MAATLLTALVGFAVPASACNGNGNCDNAPLPVENYLNQGRCLSSGRSGLRFSKTVGRLMDNSTFFFSQIMTATNVVFYQSTYL